MDKQNERQRTNVKQQTPLFHWNYNNICDHQAKDPQRITGGFYQGNRITIHKWTIITTMNEEQQMNNHKRATHRMCSNRWNHGWSWELRPAGRLINAALGDRERWTSPNKAYTPFYITVVGKHDYGKLFLLVRALLSENEHWMLCVSITRSGWAMLLRINFISIWIWIQNSHNGGLTCLTDVYAYLGFE